jgi:hypothetical protein
VHAAAGTCIADEQKAGDSAQAQRTRTQHTRSYFFLLFLLHRFGYIKTQNILGPQLFSQLFGSLSTNRQFDLQGAKRISSK